MQIHVNKNGQQIGPYALEQVNQYLEQDSLLPTDPAWHEGLAGWVPLNQVEGVVVPGASAPPLFDPDAFSASPPPPAAPSTPSPEPTPSPVAPKTTKKDDSSESLPESWLAPAEPTQPPDAGPPVAMGTICPQCNATVQPGQVVCMNCGSHLHAMPTAGKKGAGKLIAIIGGSVLVLALLGGGLFFFVMKGDLLGNNKKKRVQCVDNIGNVYKAGLAFAQDNGERLPWQLTSSGVRNHIDLTTTASDQYGRQISSQLNEVKAHPNSLASAGVYGLTAMKAELVTPKILHSPCDPDRTDANEIVQENWSSYDTKTRGVSAELGKGASYVLVRGADSQRPSSVYAVTRNWSDDRLDTGKWLGSNSASDNERTMAKLKASQGQLVTMDGGSQQATNANLGSGGSITKAANTATGGCARGRTSLNLIRGPGL